MVREVLVKQWCDVCMAADDARIEAETFGPFTLGKGSASTVDLCAEHRATILEPFIALISEHGRLTDEGKTTRKAKVPRTMRELEPDAEQPTDAAGFNPRVGPRVGANVVHGYEGDKLFHCPVADCTGYGPGYARADNLRSHVRRMHDITKDEYDELYGKPQRGSMPPLEIQQQQATARARARSVQAAHAGKAGAEARHGVVAG